MLPYRPPQIDQPSLPPHCEPADEFLQALSITFHTCIPSYLALISTLLGTCSIISWLFAQLPQIYKNHKLKSTSGLSVYFLTEWLLGDLTNLLGCLFTGQATWQIVIAGYYVLVDCGLTGQWVWYELLHHGRPLRPIWGRWKSGENDNGNGSSGMQQVSKGKTPEPTDTKSDKKDMEVQHSAPLDAFRIPNFARSTSGVKESYPVSPMGGPQLLEAPGTPTNRNIPRVAASSSPFPSPKTVLYISMIFAVLSHGTVAHPTSPSPISTLSASGDTGMTTRELLGKFFSWSSTFLYLGSRLPQLYKNQVRRSTAGLSPSLFAAAFFGNLFYSTSLLTNPSAWQDFPPHSGWTEEGTKRTEWILRALPFFLGAAGVLLMDAAVGLQFVYFGDGELKDARGRPILRDDEIIVTVDDHGVPKRRKLHWRRVSGWMRGWAPAVSVAATPSVSRATTPAQTPTPRNLSPASTEGSRSQSIPIRGAGGALDEARALLGTSRHASPRSYGALSSPR
ncbi:PQ-loop-domain-containing protein [Macroventuria anomochaeta]|uniref:PQ-loop-domain-containing protein n=1 Tax=Macroventuria anomochaeta TaxID=301207 RepID=A0ACB6RIW9_9PLEO|nr:PQ-loop-domain-containing protein [Macroventuria anomochaeta]KAF2621768.1 PQ-loop-domain-containing protein [Macroventuria anomochaeta]